MKALICDLDATQRAELGLESGYDVVIGQERLEAAHDCVGCFGCWTRTPGRCVLRDGLADLGALLGTTDELHLISRNALGGYSPLVKRALDRSIPYLHPCFRILDGEMHHRMRHDGARRTGGAGTRFVQKIWLYGDTAPDEREGFLDLVRANQLNQDCEVAGVWFCDELAAVGRERAEENAWQPESTHGARHLPRTLVPASPDAPEAQPARCIALINASPKGRISATAALLADFEDALIAYDRLSASAMREDGEGPSFVHAACRTIGDLSGAETGELAACDAAVIGFPLYVDALPAGLTALAERLARGEVLAAGTRVWAIGNLGFYEPEQLEGAFSILARACTAGGLAWCGALAVGGGGMVLATKDAPRMGMLRRKRSEAIDRLVAAVRTGLDVRAAAETFGATLEQADAAARGVIQASCPLPRFAYRLAAESGWKSACKKAGVDIDATPEWMGI